MALNPVIGRANQILRGEGYFLFEEMNGSFGIVLVEGRGMPEQVVSGMDEDDVIEFCLAQIGEDPTESDEDEGD